jgi:hypothetical protein
MEGFILKKLNEVETKEHYHVEISNGFAAFENVGTEGMLTQLLKILERI